MKMPTQKELRRLVEDSLDDLGCDVEYNALPKEEVLEAIAAEIKKKYADVEEYAERYEDPRS